MAIGHIKLKTLALNKRNKLFAIVLLSLSIIAIILAMVITMNEPMKVKIYLLAAITFVLGIFFYIDASIGIKEFHKEVEKNTKNT